MHFRMAGGDKKARRQLYLCLHAVGEGLTDTVCLFCVNKKEPEQRVQERSDWQAAACNTAQAKCQIPLWNATDYLSTSLSPPEYWKYSGSSSVTEDWTIPNFISISKPAE